MGREEQLFDNKKKVSFNLARLKTGGSNFEIVVDADKAIALRHGASIDIREIIHSEKIFSDAQRGMLASEHEMTNIFKTSDPLEVAKLIIQKGEIQLTTEYRDQLREEKRRKIINIIHRNAVDPRTGLPHPPVRIENAFAEAKVKVDEYKKAEDQIQDIMKKLRVILPIKFETREIKVKIPAQYAGKSYSVLKNFGTLVKDEWQDDGSLIAIVELPAGMQQEFYDELNKLTRGSVESEVIKARE